MTNRMAGCVLSLLLTLFSPGDAVAQTYTQMQWGMNKAVTPYQFGANINGTWRNLGTVTAAGAWEIPPNIITGLAPSATIDTTITTNINHLSQTLGAVTVGLRTKLTNELPSPADFGAIASETEPSAAVKAANTVAFQTMLTNTCTLELPVGTFWLSGGLSSTGPSSCDHVVIRGKSWAYSKIIFDGSIGTGILLDHSLWGTSTDTEALELYEVSILTTQAATGTAVSFTGKVNLATPGRFQPRVVLDNVLISGADRETGAGNGWGTALRISEGTGTYLSNVWLIGCCKATSSAQAQQQTTQSAYGINYDGTAVPSPLVGTNVWISNFNTGVRLYGNFQGVTLANFNEINVNTGIIATNQISSGAGAQLIQITNSQFTTFGDVFNFNGMPDVLVSNSLFLNDPRGKQNANLINLTGGSNIKFRDSILISYGGWNGAYPSNGVVLNDSIVNSEFCGLTFQSSAPGTNPVSISIASPATITLTDHGLPVDTPVKFATTGALPTGLTAGTTYYVISAGLTANSFRVSATPGGAAVNTSGSQSGAHTVQVAYSGSFSTGIWQKNASSNQRNKFACENTFLGDYNVQANFDQAPVSSATVYGRPGALLYRTAAASIPNTMNTQLTFSTTEYDTSAFDNTSGGLVIRPGSGIHRAQICAGGTFASTTATQIYIGISKGASLATTYPGYSIAQGNVAGHPLTLQTCTPFLSVNENDVFYAIAYQNSGGAVDLTDSWFSVIAER